MESLRKHRRLSPVRVMTAGLVTELVGVGWDALWRGSLVGVVGDHIVSNLGVIVLLAGSVWLLRREQSWQRPAVAAAIGGSLLQAVGSVIDLSSHPRGTNSPVAFALIGLGFLLASAGVVITWRKAWPRHGRRLAGARCSPAIERRRRRSRDARAFSMLPAQRKDGPGRPDVRSRADPIRIRADLGERRP